MSKLSGGQDEQKQTSAEAMDSHANSRTNEQTATLEIIRRRVDAAYGDEPSMETEVSEVKSLDKTVRLSKHQQYIKDLTNSDMTVNEMHKAWHNYYQELSADEKHEVWQEFYQTYGHKEQYKDYASVVGLPKQFVARRTTSTRKTLDYQRKPRKIPKQVHSILVGLASGSAVVIIILFSFFNERFIAPFIQPSRAITSAPLISGASTIGPNPEVIIPKINVEIPVVYGLSSIDENSIDNALADGVLHYPGTPEPGQNGNVVVVGHSSNNIFNKGKYKFAFVLLSRLDNGDTFYLQKDGKRYTYQVYKKEIVKPDNTSVLGTADRAATATLITCDPPGTSINRLVVTGEQIDPAPTSNTAGTTDQKLLSQTTVVPGNSPSLWSRFWNWISN